METGIEPADKAALNKEIKETKEKLKTTIEGNMGIVRAVRPEAQVPSNIVSIFDSALTRCLGMSPSALNPQLIIIKVYYFGVATGIIKNGFDMNGDHYVFFSASAGQIRTKKLVAIREKDWLACRDTLTCGLSADDINAAGGVNINKYLAYLALSNSATTPWKSFNINRAIVINDFETSVTGLVDFIDEKDYSITRCEKSVAIEHTDGCGMILPQVSRRSFMVRAPWIKGLLVPFPFDKFVRQANEREPGVNHAIIKDIYGVEHDILAEHIEVIFTKSQFKLWKYYDGWTDYQKKFRLHGCMAGKCNEEPRYIDDGKFNYQMLQTLTSMTDAELEKLCERTNKKLRNLTSERQTMLQVFGAVKGKPNRNAYQDALMIYPELLQDPYSKDTLRDLKASLEKQARAARLDVDGKYLFLVPDLYAACQQWFEGIETPEGLLGNGEVYCRIYKNEEELDVLRSPHLYKEHAVRTNIAGQREDIGDWFVTDGIYTSSYDLISRILQFDNDGDKSLVVADPTIVAVAKRECLDVVPLYYPMAKASAEQITPDALYNGMMHAWTGGNIGEISNSITKIWNSANPDVDAVKILCMENNFVIDYAKTLYKPTRPIEWDERLQRAIHGKVPFFFQYAKDKTPQQTEAKNASITNRLYDKIQIYKFDFKKKQLGMLDHTVLMRSRNRQLKEEDMPLIKEYEAAAKKIGKYNIDIGSDKNTYVPQLRELKETLSKYGSEIYITDVLVKYLFGVKNSKHKAVFWDCYGQIALENIRNNLDGRMTPCKHCGKRFVPIAKNNTTCTECSEADRGVENAIKICTCLRCGGEFRANGLGQTICPACAWESLARQPTSDYVAICSECGEMFDLNRRGRQSKLCQRCKHKNEKARKLRYIHQKRYG